MSKIVQAVNAMISHKALITKVIASNNEIFFLYKGKYLWSTRVDPETGEIWLWHYPNETDVEAISNLDGMEWEQVPVVTYKASEIGTKEARATFAELHSIVKERLYGMDEVLDDIISDGDSF